MEISHIFYILIFLLLLFDSIINLFALTFYHFDTKLINLFNLQGSHEFIWTLRRKWTQFYRVIFNTAFIANAHLTKSWYHQALHLHEINVFFWLQFPGFYWEVTANGSIWFKCRFFHICCSLFLPECESKALQGRKHTCAHSREGARYAAADAHSGSGFKGFPGNEGASVLWLCHPSWVVNANRESATNFPKCFALPLSFTTSWTAEMMWLCILL